MHMFEPGNEESGARNQEPGVRCQVSGELSMGHGA